VFRMTRVGETSKVPDAEPPSMPPTVDCIVVSILRAAFVHRGENQILQHLDVARLTASDRYAAKQLLRPSISP